MVTDLARVENDPQIVEWIVTLEREGILGPLGLRLTDANLSYERYEALGRWLGAVRDMTAWAIGDWLLFGEGLYGERAAQAVEVTGRSKSTLTNYARVAGRVAPPRRRVELSWSHHEAVAALPPDEQIKWLSKAVDEQLSVEEFRGEVPKQERAGSLDAGATGSLKGVVIEELEKEARRIAREAQFEGERAYVDRERIVRLRAVLGEEDD